MSGQIKTMHLFAGAGGGLLCDLILGHTPIVAVEWDSYACKVLRERAKDGWWPHLHVWEGDVRMFDPSEYSGKVDCLHAGFPCTDISTAGKQEGLGVNTRSGLYREALRVAGILRPKLIYLENVAAIVSNGLGTVLGDLAALGYDCKWLCLRASDCGAPHHRDRFWLLAYPNGVRQQESRTYGYGVRSEKEKDREAIEPINGSFGDFWRTEPGLGRVADGVVDREHRLKALGNGQVPLQAAVAFKMLSAGLQLGKM